jgi:hypothetical protein
MVVRWVVFKGGVADSKTKLRFSVSQEELP